MPDVPGSPQELTAKVLQGGLSILTGQAGSGKSTFLASWLSWIEKELPSVEVGGVLCRARFQSGVKVGYELEQLPGGARCLFASRDTLAGEPGGSGVPGLHLSPPHSESPDTLQQENGVRVGRWFIFQKALEQAQGAIVSAVRGACDLVVIDEFGPLELQGQGFRSATDELACCGKAGILVVREGILEEVRRLYGASISNVVPVSQMGAVFSLGSEAS